MAPAVASPHIIARKRLNLNSFLATVNCRSPSVPNSASTWVSVLLIAMMNVNASAAANMNRLKEVM